MFARTGAEANAMAQELEEHTQKTKYSRVLPGWHDWYFQYELNNDKKSKQHLLPGLGADGVLKQLHQFIHLI